MADATTHTAIALNVAASSASLAAGTLLGVPFVVIGLALLGGAISHIYIKGVGRVRTVMSIIGSTVIGIMAAEVSRPLMIALATQYLPTLVPALNDGSVGGKTMVAFWVAFLAHKLVPIFFNWLDREAQGGN